MTAGAAERTPAATSISAGAAAGVVHAAQPATTAATGARQADTPQTADARPELDSPFVAPLEAAAAELPATAAPSSAGAAREIVPQRPANEPAPVVRTTGSTSDSFSWLIWLAGSGIALILALLLFGRRLKDRFVPAAAPEETFARRRTDRDLEDTDVSPILGLPSEGTAPVARMVSLDADLDDGSGFQYGGDIDVAQDFGFSDDSGQFPSGLDMDLSGSGAGGAEPDTDIIPPHRAEATILVSETPPQRDDTGEYDLSMIVDATKQVVGDSNATTKDLRAIRVDAGDDEDTVSEEYSLSREVDYKVLEQDYEDELTATQALSAELAKAARALSSQYGKDEMGDTISEETGELAAPVFDSGAGDEVTAEMPAVAAGRDATDETAEIPAQSTAISLDDTANDETADALPPAENDSTAEVEIESATIDTRKMRA